MSLYGRHRFSRGDRLAQIARELADIHARRADCARRLGAAVADARFRSRDIAQAELNDYARRAGLLEAERADLMDRAGFDLLASAGALQMMNEGEA